MIMSHFIVFLQKVVPHITDAIQEWIERVAMVPVDGKEGPADVCVIELGGTIGENKFYAASMQAFYALHLWIFFIWDLPLLIKHVMHDSGFLRE